MPLRAVHGAPADPPLPSFAGGGLPAPESGVRKSWIRSVAVLAIAVSLAYLGWRVLFTVEPASWWISFPFLFLEIHAVISLGLFTFALWDIDVRPSARRVESSPARIAVLVPTYNESRDILLPTITAAVAVDLDHETWVLDDGCRPEVEQLAAELGARYLARPDRTDAKAGNINHALEHVDADFVAILDADHVAAPNFLRNLLGYFDDPKVALVQTPQDFYNLESFEHGQPKDTSKRAANFHEQQLFYRAIQPGKNRWQAAFWCGTGAVVRVAALREVGGVATGTVTEDILTTIRLHRRGWKTIYHNEVLARGLAASTSEQFQLQRFRWGTGAMQVLRSENPFVIPGLTLSQRVAYASTLLGWFESWRSLGYLVVPIVVLFTGAMPVQADPMAFAIAFGVTFTCQQGALRLLSRGHHRFILSVVFDLVRLTPNLLATLLLVWPGRRSFQVTPKGRQEDERVRVEPPALLVVLVGSSMLSVVWFFLTMAGWTWLKYPDPLFAYGASFWVAFNLSMLLIAISRIRSVRYGPERRASVRFSTGLPAWLDLRPCVVHEVSLTGGQVSIEGGPAEAALNESREVHRLTVVLDSHVLALRAAIRWKRPGEDARTTLGLEFDDSDLAAQAHLYLAMLNGEIPKRPVAQQRAAWRRNAEFPAQLQHVPPFRRTPIRGSRRAA